MARSTARKRALNTLFEADVKGQEILSLLDERIAYPGAQTPLPEYAIEIVRGVAHHRRTIDKAIGDTLNSWEVKRMPAIDRNLARMATWEIVYNDEIPAGVAIDEALALAKTLAGEETPDFLYGVLSTIEKKSDDIRQEEIQWQEERAAQAADQEADSRVSKADSADAADKDVTDVTEEKNFSDISIHDFHDASSSIPVDNNSDGYPADESGASSAQGK